MSVPCTRNGLPGGNPWKGGDTHGPCQNFWHQRLANANQSKGRPFLPWLLQFLPHLHQRFLMPHTTTQCINKEGRRMEVDRARRQSFPYAKESSHVRTCTGTPKSRPTICTGDRCVRICNRRSIIPEAKRWETPPGGLLFSHPQRS